VQDVPDPVALRFALRVSAAENPDANINTGTMCSRTGCLTSANQPRRANKECEQKYCSQCCKANPPSTGCSAHKLKPRDIPPSLLNPAASSSEPGDSATVLLPSTSSEPAPQAITRSFARPLKDDHMKAYVEIHHKKIQVMQSFEQARELAASISNTVHVVLWTQVRIHNNISMYEVFT
jgi:hypothetical protein